MNASREPAPAPWYRHPYVWLLMAFPALSVVAGVTTLVVATRIWDGLVVDDYYRRGILINQELGRDRAATRRGLAAAIDYRPGAAQVRVLLTAAPRQPAPPAVRVSFLHRTRAGFDQSVEAMLAPAAPDAPAYRYEAKAPALVRGHWDVLIEADDWRLLDSIVVP